MESKINLGQDARRGDENVVVEGAQTFDCVAYNEKCKLLEELDCLWIEPMSVPLGLVNVP